MPDVHQPGPEDRAAAEAADADQTAPDPAVLDVDADRVERLREERPSSRNDPNAPDRPLT